MSAVTSWWDRSSASRMKRSREASLPGPRASSRDRTQRRSSSRRAHTVREPVKESSPSSARATSTCACRRWAAMSGGRSRSHSASRRRSTVAATLGASATAAASSATAWRAVCSAAETRLRSTASAAPEASTSTTRLLDGKTPSAPARSAYTSTRALASKSVGTSAVDMPGISTRASREEGAWVTPEAAPESTPAPGSFGRDASGRDAPGCDAPGRGLSRASAPTTRSAARPSSRCGLASK